MPHLSVQKPPLPWLLTGEEFPCLETAWGHEHGAPGLLAAGDDLSAATLIRAYSRGIFPWFSQGDPVLWWSPDPRMVLAPPNFRFHKSLRKTLRHLLDQESLEIKLDTQFEQVIAACARSTRQGQSVGTWIQPRMIEAYCQLHRQGIAHSVETWIDGQLVGGLYCIALGKAIFGESMFSLTSNASKIALSALVVLCLKNGVPMIDCQQNTAHLALMGGQEIPRTEFANHLNALVSLPPINWQFSNASWAVLHPSLA